GSHAQNSAVARFVPRIGAGPTADRTVRPPACWVPPSSSLSSIANRVPSSQKFQRNQRGPRVLRTKSEGLREPMMPAVEATLRSHPGRPAHPDAMSRCIESCFTCAGACTACADACLSERDVERLLASIRQDLDSPPLY